jgi:para-nitrobenzyl esterase
MDMKRLVLTALAGLVAGVPGLARAEPIRTDKGLVEGVIEDGVGVYKGVPFAAPPVGDLRWRPPQPAKAWTGVLEADAYKPRCMQVGPNYPFAPDEAMSENCLYLNIWTPPDAGKTPGKLPVMVWIYGGSFQNGSASDPFYRGASLARRGVIYVGINYRVGVMGFLAHPALTAESSHRTSGDYGLMDMIAGLKWVKANISAFGGDPDKVTIFGQSAGSAAVAFLAASPEAKGLFRGAIGESGGSFRPPGAPLAAGDLKSAEAYGQGLMDKLAVRTAAQMRALPADKAAAAGPTWPEIDGWIVPEDLPSVFAAGRQNDVPTIVGYTDDEAANAGSPPLKAADFTAMIRKTYGPFADRIFAVYPAGTDAEAAVSQRRASRDGGAGWEAWTWARLQSATGRSRVYHYYFARRPPLPDQPTFKDWGAQHGAELFYLFGYWPTGFTPTDEDRRYGETVARYWIDFVKTGDPNGAGLPAWPAFSAAAPMVLNFERSGPVATAAPHQPELKLTDEVLAAFKTGTLTRP